MVQQSAYRRITLLPYVLAVLLVLSVGAQAQISIIVSKSSSQSAEASSLKQMFAGTKLSWSGGEKIMIADQQETAVGKAFYEKFVDKSVTAVRTEWTKLVLSGQAMAPKKCADDDAVKKAVADNPNAVGYISSSSLDGTVKEIHRIQ
jgi:ABC-type phosphate transport system substrate-binding protein